MKLGSARSKIYKFVAGVAAAGLLISASGCGAKDKAEQDVSPQPVEQVEEVATVHFGDEINGVAALQFLNKTEFDIVAMAARAAGTDTYTPLEISGAEKYAPEEVADVFIPASITNGGQPESVDGASNSEDPAGLDAEFKDLIDLQVTFADSTTSDLFQLPVDEYSLVEDLAINYSADDELVYLSGTDNTGSFSTLESQKAIAEAAAEQAAAEQAAAEQAAAEQAAAEQAAAEQAAAEQAAAEKAKRNSNPSTSGTSTPAPSSNVDQSADVCIEDDQMEWK